MPEMRPWSGRAILHVDMDAFFAAIEQLDNPEWCGRPVIVGGSPDGRGVVSTASYEARESGVRSAMPSAQAVRLCPGAVWVWPRMERYAQMSRIIREIFSDFTPRVEPISIDEAFLDVTPGEYSSEHPIGIAGRIRARIAETGLTASIGLASGKTVAKIASDLEKPSGLTVVWPGGEADFLAPLPVGTMSGIGAVTQKKLGHLGLKTLGDLAALDKMAASQILGSHGPGLVRRAQGVDARPVESGRTMKSVSHERTFSVDVTSEDEVRAILRRLSSGVVGRLRHKGLKGRTVTVKLRFADFTTRTVQRTLEEPIDLEDEVYPIALDLVESSWSEGAGLRLLGVSVSGFDEATSQLDLFQEDTEAVRGEHRRKLADSLDRVTERFGKDAIGYGPSREIRPATPAYDPPDDEENGSG